MYVLLVRCPSDLLVILIETIRKQLIINNQQPLVRDLDILGVMKRFIRGITRLLVILCNIALAFAIKSKLIKFK